MPFKPRQLPNAADLWERYAYNPLTGEVFSRLHPKRKALGYPSRLGYMQTVIRWHGEVQNVFMHRLVWKWVHGTEPGETIDHINRIRTDNRAWNLRIADMFTQRANRSDSPDRHTGLARLPLPDAC